MNRKPLAVRETRQHAVTVVHDAGCGETFIVPGMLVTLRQLRAMARGGGLVQVWCETCAESVVDCPELRATVAELAPAEWSTMRMVD